MHNTKLRMKASNDFEKDYYKLLNNSFYGKTMENVRGHRDIELVTNRSVLASEPNYHGNKHISEVIDNGNEITWVVYEQALIPRSGCIR